MMAGANNSMGRLGKKQKNGKAGDLTGYFSGAKDLV